MLKYATVKILHFLSQRAIEHAQTHGTSTSDMNNCISCVYIVKYLNMFGCGKTQSDETNISTCHDILGNC